MPTSKSHLAAFILILFSVSVWTFPLSAAQVIGVKGKRVLVLLTPDETSTVKAGDTFYTKDGDKKLGVLRIVKIKNNRAMAGILKGRAQKGNSLEPTKQTGRASGPSTTLATEGLILGALLGYNMTTMSIKGSSGASTSLTGGGFAGKLFGDFGLVEKLGVRFETGLEQMVAKGDCTTVACQAELNYFTGDLMLRYNVMNGATKFFLASGMGIYFPMSLTGEAIKKPSLQTTLLIKAGVLFPMGTKYYVPLQAEYVYFPSSQQVTTSMIGVKLGLGMRW